MKAIGAVDWFVLHVLRAIPADDCYVVHVVRAIWDRRLLRSPRCEGYGDI